MANIINILALHWVFFYIRKKTAGCASDFFLQIEKILRKPAIFEEKNQSRGWL